MDEEITGQTPEEEPTSALPPADEGATEVIGGGAEQPTTVMGGAGATRVMPAAGGAAPPSPPPSRPTPTLMMSRPPRRESSGKTWWIVLIVVILAAAAAAGLWYFVLRNKNTTPAPTPTPTPTASAVEWGGAWGRTDGVAGGIVIEQNGASYQVTVYDSGLQPTGTATGSVSSDGSQLRFTLPASSSFNTMPGPLTGVMTIQSGEKTALLTMTAANQTSVTMPLKRVLALVPGTPTASPTPSTSPTTSGSPSPSASPVSAVDQQIIAGLTKIQTGVTTWAANNGDLYPMPTDVSQTGGIAQYVVPWPLNPVTNQPMVQGGAVGNYTYQQINGGQSYTLVGHLSSGVSYTLP
jgi:hypothetical protein